MPVQSAFTYLIIGGAFTATGSLLLALNYLYEGKSRRSIQRDYWKFNLEQRDKELKEILKVEDKLE